MSTNGGRKQICSNNYIGKVQVSTIQRSANVSENTQPLAKANFSDQSLVLLYKCIFCNGPSYIKDLFEFRQSVYNLRGNRSNLCQPKFNLSWKKQSFSYKLVMLWNKLPSSVRLSSSLKDFES